MIKAIFFDIDGTLLSFQTHRLSPAVLSDLHALRERGIKLFIATGRHRAMLPYIRSVFPFDGYVTLNGQYCTIGDRVVRRHPIAQSDAQGILAATRDGLFPCIYLEEDRMSINQVNGDVEAFMAQLDLDLPPIRTPAAADGIYQAIVFLTQEREHLLRTRAPGVNAARWHPLFIDVMPPDGGKDRGMDAILDELNIPLADTMAFGDGENDLSMLIHAGIGVAMGSASDAVKEQADYVTGTVDEDGISTALRHFGVL